MRYIFLILIYIILPANTNFSLIIDKIFDSTLYDINQDYNKNLVSVGFSKNFNTTIQNNTYYNIFDYLESQQKYGLEIEIIRVNKNAKLINSKILKLKQFNKAISILKTPQDGYFIGGYSMDGRLIILKLNNNFKIINQKLFGTKNFNKMNNLLLLRDGGILAIGSSYTSRDIKDDIFLSGLGKNDIYISRFDKNLNLLWSKKYGSKDNEFGIDGVEVDDGSFIIVGEKYNNKNKKIISLRISQNGDKIWLKEYHENYILNTKKIISLPYNNFLISVNKEKNNNKYFELMKLDLDGDIITKKSFLFDGSMGINDIDVFINGDIIAIGYKEHQQIKNAFALILNSSLSIKYKKEFFPNRYTIFNKLKILSNSNIAICGLNTSIDSQKINMWITKLNKNLSIVKLDTNSNLYAELLKLFNNEIKNHKLKISKNLNIEFLDKSLYFNIAQYKLKEKQKQFIQKFSLKLIPFLYKYKNIIDTLEIIGHTSKEWNTNFTNRYLKNEDLSLKRSLSVLNYIFKLQNTKNKLWLSKVLKSSGLSFREQKKNSNEKSRKVNFKIILKENK